uniref:Uncharacterized protein n=1 Tax=Chenopodium quinoa TaxID=63459 RepID=A0A803LEM3_CHEQI
MSVVGFDFGNESCVVAVARQRGIDVVLNDESKRETPAIVCFGDKQRFIGTAGAASAMMNPKTTISQIKRLIGRQFSDPELQKDLKSMPFMVTEGPDGYPLIHVKYLGETKTFTPTQVLGMLFSNLKGIAEKNLNAAVVDCCIGIPTYFTDLQRRAVIDAATIAGLHPLRLIHETTATALAYGIYKTDLPESDPINVAFVDVGHSSLQDVRGFIKREEFEQICIPILERVKKPLEKALAEAGLTVDQIHAVELVGSASRIPAVLKILTDFFGKDPRRTMNASECVAKGCALQCAILSPTFKVKEFQVNESFPFPISLSWKGVAADGQNEAAEGQQTITVIPKGSTIPCLKAVTILRSGTFAVDVQYADVSELQAPAKISSYTIGPIQSTNGDRAKLKVRVRLNLHGIVAIESATLLEEEEVEVPVVKETTKMDTDDTANETPAGEADVNMQDAKGAAEATAAENGTPESGGKSTSEADDKPVQMDTDAKADATKKKVKKTNVPVTELVHGGLSPVDLQKAVEKEFELALQDRVMEETKDRKNAVEAYVYDMRNKLNDKYQEFVIPSEKDEFIARLQEVEDWLYEDGEDEIKSVYVAKLEELKKARFLDLCDRSDPIEERYKDHMERGNVIKQLAYCINSYRDAVMLNDPKFDHIDLADKQKVVNACVEAEAWLREKQQQQDALPKYATPALRSADVLKKTEELDRLCRPIMTKPKPAPPKPATPEPQPQQAQGGESPSPGGDANPGGGADDSNETPNAEPMDTEKPETAPGSA